jgi:hypothetical protein
MTSTVRRIAGGLTVLESAWLLYSFFYEVRISCPNGGCPFPNYFPFYSQIVISFAVALLVIGILGVWGASFAYLGSVIISTLTLLLMAYTVLNLSGYAYLSPESDNAVVECAVAVVAIIGNAAGARGKSGLSEQANPMNLPVFG